MKHIRRTREPTTFDDKIPNPYCCQIRKPFELQLLPIYLSLRAIINSFVSFSVNMSVLVAPFPKQMVLSSMCMVVTKPIRGFSRNYFLKKRFLLFLTKLTILSTFCQQCFVRLCARQLLPENDRLLGRHVFEVCYPTANA